MLLYICLLLFNNARLPLTSDVLLCGSSLCVSFLWMLSPGNISNHVSLRMMSTLYSSAPRRKVGLNGQCSSDSPHDGTATTNFDDITGDDVPLVAETLFTPGTEFQSHL